MSREIPLTQGKVAIVCDCHAHLVENDKWQAAWDKSTRSFRAMRTASPAERLLGAPRTIYMHAVVNKTPRGMQTDHINHDTLDNCCLNLRTATRAQNNSNRRRPSNNTSGFKGVSFNQRRRKWEAQISIDDKHKFLGYFETAKTAAEAYDSAAKELHGEFARLNLTES
jgi:hypothetical protein